ncbi:iron-containing alcohol dehydrogenase [Vibrio sp. D431a]|uniref:iron-containing alcohol dehydrogenase n=1 Tax=Vibrio sp. D431a TaxID=2837388 RepID=UPI0025554060|nr:iron-containing alcohol dehydrogenase [Vibrio sp. D431a]MDK9790157.1 iron-containing alcohol dehydrogenase [Vibrio sp. D431a]
MSSTFYLPTTNIIGENALEESIEQISSLGFKKILIITDKPIVSLGFADLVKSLLSNKGIETFVYSGVQPNPTVENAEEGLALIKKYECDAVISLGGGSPHDAAKASCLLATNGGTIHDYEGVNRSKYPQLPLIAINTTAGTASEITRFCIVTDPERHIKMAIVDVNVTPTMSVNDPFLMKKMPNSLTAATGLDALTHAVEALVSTASTHVTDACAEKAIHLISTHLRSAVKDGDDMVARDGMANAQLLAGMAFNSASLGYVHALAHQLGGLLDLPHGVCNAVLLPHVQRFNSKVAAGKLAIVAREFGIDVSNMSQDEAAKKAIEEMVSLAKDVNIPSGLSELGVRFEHLDKLADNALKDACGFTNPIKATHEELVSILKSAM